MIRIGITGQNGFIGKHLYNTIGLAPQKYERIPFEKEFFEDEQKLDAFVKQCDVIVHLAAKNRHNDPEVIYNTNIELVKKLIAALERTGSALHVIFSSSSQEELGNPYGNSKKEGRELLADWAEKNGGKFSGLVIPNVFGPFGHPYYNSVVATFSYQLSHNEEPQVHQDGYMKLIYVGELVSHILQIIDDVFAGHIPGSAPMYIQHTSELKVTELLRLLKSFKENYMDSGVIPAIRNTFELNLFNTFRCYMPHGEYFPRKFQLHRDERGAFVEIIRLGVGGQVSFSTTAPGITRGNHFHTRKIERFAVIKGKALIQLRQIGTGNTMDFYLDGSEPAYVDMPIWYTHNIKNIGDEELYTNFWINEHYDPADADTFFEKV